MNNLDRYLKQDIGQAVQLTKKYWMLTDELQQKVTQGNLNGAKEVAIKMVEVVNELEYMQHKKKQHDMLDRLEVFIKKEGIASAEVVWRRAQDQ